MILTDTLTVSAGNKIQCFECNTWEDPRCHDPWSWAYPVVSSLLIL